MAGFPKWGGWVIIKRKANLSSTGTGVVLCQEQQQNKSQYMVYIY